ncbi:hypothetical protein ACQJBY_040338 [Aegilops geniculata]
MASLAIPDELLVDILLRLPTPEDLIHASAACVSFRRLITDRSFLRRFRKIHPPPLLGFLDPVVHRFHPAVRPHRSAPAAGAVALAADFSFAFLPAPGSSFAFLPAPARDWTVREVRDGRVLLDRPRRHDSGDGLEALFKEMVVCDPLHRQYLLLPPIPDDIAASVADQLLIYGQSFADTFLVPPGYDEEEAATATAETSFRVIWVVLHQAKQMAVVFSSRTGQWRALTRSKSLPLPDFTWMVHFRSRHYAHGCFYWISGEKLLVLDIQRMEFSMADHPPCARAPSDDVAIAEAGQGTIRMFVPTPHTARRSFTVWRNNGGSSSQWQWQMENETILLPSGSLLMGAVGRNLLLYHVGSSSITRGCYTRGVDTFQFERVCGSASLPKPSHVYCNFPPSLLSSPTVSSATPHADVRGEGGAVRVPEPQEVDAGGMEGYVLSAAAEAPNPLFVGDDEAEAGCGGRGGGAGAGAGAGPPEGAGAGGVA